MKIFLSLLSIISFSNIYSQTIYKKDSIEVVAVKESNEFQNAELVKFNIVSGKSETELKAELEVKNYELKANSNNNISGLCANSKDGQHVHMIVDNKPYTALYKTSNEFKADTGCHTGIAFLSRSHHQSIKTKKAYKLFQFNVAEECKPKSQSNPMLFYSRPKGTYVDNDTKEVLLDFYIVNCTLSPKGYKVKVEIDNKHSFMITSWSPFLIKGLSMGEHKIKLTLLDKKNKIVKSSPIATERSFVLMNNPK